MFFEHKKADPDYLKENPSLLRLLFFHDFQHHSGTQLKAVLEDQAVCNCLMLSHTISIFLKQLLLLIRHGGSELFFISANQPQQFPILFARGCIIFSWLDVAVP